MVYKIKLKVGYAEHSFTYTDYDSVQNLIGYMVEGSDRIELVIDKGEEAANDGE